MQQLDYHSSIRKVFSLLKLYCYLKPNSKICQVKLYGIGDSVTVLCRQSEIQYQMQRESSNYQRNSSTKISSVQHV